ncbi:hypothetical protein CANARDRAFT_194320 [[Candida] arabinofermentans NRRL YB-2248]|uniref:EXS domain-containing protein n=1 Tax=[Candida] arabinofermentans NRRL YB-2248 TaxID=983967 RepID=A0A1E4T5V1_9ASCO|nr:hypothetical protein CANARDRAFT_194320 [[Candida] arabinofermentans NRRL YB-2248]
MFFKRELPLDAATGVPLIQEISWFDFCLPLPYRILLLVNFGIWLWYVNLKTCYRFNIDTLLVLKLNSPELTNAKLVGSVRSACSRVTLVNGLNYAIYLILISNDYYFKLMDLLPLGGLIFTIIALSEKSSPEKKRFTSTVFRILRGNIDINIRNNDILLSDTLTSYSKVLIDFLVYISALILGYQTLPSPQDLSLELSKDHLKLYNLDLVLSSYPALIRLKQCIYEFEQSRRRNKQHLFNAIKYSTSFLPILANLLIRGGFIHGLSLWYLAVFINSTYSFFWDIKFDWNFELFTKFLNNDGVKNVPILRQKLIFNKFFYYVAILVDLQLRYIWVYRLMYPQLLERADHGVAAFVGSSLFINEFGNFVLEVLEILRRWVWVFIKIETEYIKMFAEGGGTALEVGGDIELQERPH